MTRGEAPPKSPVTARAGRVAERDQCTENRESVEPDQEWRQRHAESIAGRAGPGAAILLASIEAPSAGRLRHPDVPRTFALPGVVMRMFRPFVVLLPLALALLLCACGNKGDLVKPIPATLPPPTTTPDSTTPQPDATAKPAQDSGGH